MVGIQDDDPDITHRQRESGKAGPEPKWSENCNPRGGLNKCEDTEA